uniref:LINE-like reverse transcriptase n=1 Tax=Romanomermis culicivorax TaxID=13658 RepID=A0A915K120_ROMCU
LWNCLRDRVFVFQSLLANRDGVSGECIPLATASIFFTSDIVQMEVFTLLYLDLKDVGCVKVV